MLGAATNAALRIGIDLGGTKIEGRVLAADGSELARRRIPTPRDYETTVRALADVVAAIEQEAGAHGSVGIAMPGSMSPVSKRVQNSNSVWLNGKPLDLDLEAALGRPLKFANDANCFALSEAVDGAGAGARSVFGVILGTGCGGGFVFRGQLIDGPHGIGGEWGHNPLPWSDASEQPGPTCWCGRRGCMEVWVSGTALAADHARTTGESCTAEDIATRARSGDAAAQATLDRHVWRLARGLSHIVNVFDPEVIVLGGGLSKLEHLYTDLPRLMQKLVFADHVSVDVRPPKWGDASGVRGAAWLWS